MCRTLSPIITSIMIIIIIQYERILLTVILVLNRYLLIRLPPFKDCIDASLYFDHEIALVLVFLFLCFEICLKRDMCLGHIPICCLKPVNNNF